MSSCHQPSGYALVCCCLRLSTVFPEEISQRLFSLLIPTEFFLDLVNSDFSDEAAVSNILDTWEEKRPDAGTSHHKKKGFGEDDGQEGVTEMKRAPLAEEMGIMLKRHFMLVIRDPILYIGRCAIFFVSCLIFAFVYWNGRDFTQDQALNKMWVSIWFVAGKYRRGCVSTQTLRVIHCCDHHRRVSHMHPHSFRCKVPSNMG